MSRHKIKIIIPAPNPELLVSGDFDPFTNFYLEVIDRINPQLYKLYKKEELLKNINIYSFRVTKCYSAVLEKQVKLWIKDTLKKERKRYNKKIVDEQYLWYNLDIGPAELNEPNDSYEVHISSDYLKDKL